ncbi:putative Mitochondrial import inner membrane translocase subunit TIM14 [Balamuthia mandrillaris]
MALFLAIGLGVAGAALAGRFVAQQIKNNGGRLFPKRAPSAPGGISKRMSFKKYYEGGFEPEMTRAEAAQILNVRVSASKDKIKQAHRRIMLANHPDNGGSDYMASKVNEAKDLLMKDLGE